MRCAAHEFAHSSIIKGLKHVKYKPFGQYLGGLRPPRPPKKRLRRDIENTSTPGSASLDLITRAYLCTCQVTLEGPRSVLVVFFESIKIWRFEGKKMFEVPYSLRYFIERFSSKNTSKPGFGQITRVCVTYQVTLEDSKSVLVVNYIMFKSFSIWRFQGTHVWDSVYSMLFLRTIFVHKHVKIGVWPDHESCLESPVPLRSL